MYVKDATMTMLGDAVKKRQEYETILSNEGASTVENWKNITRAREEMQKAVAEFKSNVESLASELAALGVKPKHIPGSYVDYYKFHLCYGPTKEIDDVKIGAHYVDGNIDYYEAARILSDNDEKRDSLDIYIPSSAKLDDSSIQNNRLFKRNVRTFKKTDEGKSIYKDVMIEVINSDFHLGIDPAKDLENALANLKILKDINEHWEEHKQNVVNYYYHEEKGRAERLCKNLIEINEKLSEIDEKLGENLVGLTDEDDRSDVDI